MIVLLWNPCYFVAVVRRGLLSTFLKTFDIMCCLIVALSGPSM